MFTRRRAAPSSAGVARSQPAFSFDQWVRLFGGSASVTPTSVTGLGVALGNSVVWRCAMKNAATVSTFPVHVHRGREVLDVEPPIVADPSASSDLRQSAWVFAAVVSMYLRGGAYGWIGQSLEAAMGRPTAVPLLHPDRVAWTEKTGWTVDNDPVETWPSGPLWSVPMYVLPGSPKGLNPLEYARRSLYPGMAAQDFGGSFFGDGGHPTAIVSVDGDPVPTQEQAQQVKDRLMAVLSGGAREPLVVPANVKWQQLQVNPDDSQFIELMRLSDEQVCRYMGTPPEEVGIAPSGSSLTYANREQRKQDYLQELLLPVRRLEEAWTSLLVAPTDRVRLQTAGLLRADLAGRYASYKLAAEIGLLTLDEMRELEERPPMSDEDRKSQRTWQEVGLPALVDDGIMTVNEARGLLGLAPIAGGDKPRVPQEAGAAQ